MHGVKFAISDNSYPKPSDYRFLSSLAHEFKGEKEVLGYSNMNNALKWDTRVEAERVMNELPEWAEGKHRIVAIRGFTGEWNYERSDTVKYRGFLLRTCNDGVSRDILDGDTWNLICIVGSLDKAFAWVDKWCEKEM